MTRGVCVRKEVAPIILSPKGVLYIRLIRAAASEICVSTGSITNDASSSLILISSPALSAGAARSSIRVIAEIKRRSPPRSHDTRFSRTRESPSR